MRSIRQPFLILAKITKYIAVCLVAAGTWTSALSQHPTQNTYPTILREILSLQFEAADSLIKTAGTGTAADPEILYLRNYLEFLDALTTADPTRYDRYLSGAALRLDSLRSGYGSFPEPLPLLSAVHLQSAFLNVFHGENFKAARNFYVANRYLRQAESAHPEDPFNDKLEGLIQLVAGSAPEEYHWLMRIFGIRGDIPLGMEQLLSYHQGTTGTDRVESCLIMLYASLLAGQDPEPEAAGCEADTLTLYRYLYAYHALKSGRSPEVISLLEKRKQPAGESRLAFLDLVLGEALLTRIDPDAGARLQLFLEGSRGEHNLKTAWHKLSWFHLLNGDSAAFQTARDNVIRKGNMILEADKQAFREAGEEKIPHTGLLRSRLYFDGGYIQKSSENLQRIKPGELTGRRDSLEYTYRQARIAHRLGDTTEAISGYREIVEKGMDSDWYFPSNAALQLGLIHEALGDTSEAIETYQKCLKMNRSAYRNSIGNKAKSGISRLQ